MRQRWFGATGRRVPEIAVEGELDTSDALLLDDVADDARLRAEFEGGTPIVVRASTPEAVHRALTRPEVAAVLIPPDRRDLLDLDLVEMTYG